MAGPEKAPLVVNAELAKGCIRFSLFGKNWVLHRPSDLESLWESIADEEFSEDERLPYWTELWPASLALAQWLQTRQTLIAGKICLDLGCGLGFTALVSARLGARVIGMDYEAVALEYARRNAAANALASPCWVAMDWRKPAVARHSCAYIWGGDVLYERRFAAPVSSFLEHALAPGGRVWMAEPGRNTFAHFMSSAVNRGWNARRVSREKVQALHAQQVPVSVNIWELSRKALAYPQSGTARNS